MKALFVVLKSLKFTFIPIKLIAESVNLVSNYLLSDSVPHNFQVFGLGRPKSENCKFEADQYFFITVIYPFLGIVSDKTCRRFRESYGHKCIAPQRPMIWFFYNVVKHYLQHLPSEWSVSLKIKHFLLKYMNLELHPSDCTNGQVQYSHLLYPDVITTVADEWSESVPYEYDLHGGGYKIEFHSTNRGFSLGVSTFLPTIHTLLVVEGVFFGRWLMGVSFLLLLVDVKMLLP